MFLRGVSLLLGGGREQSGEGGEGRGLQEGCPPSAGRRADGSEV